VEGDVRRLVCRDRRTSIGRRVTTDAHPGDVQIYAQRWPVSSKVTFGVTAAWIMDVRKARRIGDRHEHKPQRQRGEHQRDRNDP
jgi:hypothetical protein